MDNWNLSIDPQIECAHSGNRNQAQKLSAHIHSDHVNFLSQPGSTFFINFNTHFVVPADHFNFLAQI